MTQEKQQKNTWQKRLRRWSLEAAFFVLFLFLLHLWQTRNAVEGPAPELSGITLQGEQFQLRQSDPRPTLVYFWATWCHVCGLQSGVIDELSTDYRVMTVTMQSGDRQAVRQHLQAEKLNFPVINDPDGTISGRWGIKGVPTSYLIDRQGNISSVSVGYTTGLGLKIRLWLADWTN